jgi:hypothetical protein
MDARNANERQNRWATGLRTATVISVVGALAAVWHPAKLATPAHEAMEQDVIAAKVEQQRLAHIVAEREILEARAGKVRSGGSVPAAADGPRSRARRGGSEWNNYEPDTLTN